MFREVRDAAPTVLVPAAWVAAAAAHFGYLSETGMFVAHLVMAGFIAVFTVTGWSLLGEGALRAWRAVLVVGFVLTCAGVAGFLVPAARTPLLAASLVGWMVLPAAGLAYTGAVMPRARLRYYGSGALSAVGAAVFVATVASGVGGDTVTLTAFVLVGVGQTAGIIDASSR